LTLPEYDDLDGLGMAELVRTGQVSPAELLTAAAERIEARNPALNAVIRPLVDHAKARIKTLPDGPFHGVPFLLKDLKVTLAGVPTSNASRLTRDWCPDRNSVTTERYLAAGLQILGKTNTPEFGLMGCTEPKLWGPTRNPWNTDHTPGGSSGGSAAAVAARMVPIAQGGDGGGSIRIPASCCGLFGLKPTRGRVTLAPWAGEGWGGFAQEHALTRSVRDSAGMLDVVDQPTPGEPYVAPPHQGPWLAEVERDPGRLRIAFCRETLYAGETHPDCLAAIDQAVALLQELDHQMVEAAPIIATNDLIRAYFLTVGAGIAGFVEETAAKAGTRPRARDFEPATWLFAQIGWKGRASELDAARRTMHQASRDLAAFLGETDVFLTSTMARPPALVGELYPSGAKALQLRLLNAVPLKPLLDIAMDTIGRSTLAATPNTQLFNQTGHPAMSVPLCWNDQGLPIGVQFAGRFGDEATLFRLAGQLEKARPWVDRKPDF
jgi:amidase